MKVSITIEDTNDGQNCTTLIKCDPPTELHALPADTSSAALLTAMIVRLLNDVQVEWEKELSRS